MRFLFVHQHFPGQFLHLLRDLVRQGVHQIIFISEPNANHLPGVQRLTYPTPVTSRDTHDDARDFDLAMRRAAVVAEIAGSLRDAGFRPDIVIGHEGWGETLNLRDVWPTQPIVGYREYFYHLEGADVGFDPEFPVGPGAAARIRAKNATSLLALNAAGPGVSPTEWQRSLYPGWSRPAIALVPEGVDLGRCAPRPEARAHPFQLGPVVVAPAGRLVTFVARELEPYRGFHVLMRALPAILAARRDVQVVCLGGDGVSYGVPPEAGGTWREAMLRQVGVDPGRVHFPGKVPYADYLRLLQRSDVHAYLSYPFIPSWSLREAMACGCAIVAGDTPAVAEFAVAGETATLVAPLDSGAVADRILALLDNDEARSRLSRGARRFAEANLGLARHLACYAALIQAAVGLGNTVWPMSPGIRSQHVEGHN